MTAQFQYTTLAHQTAAVQAIADVFADVRFVPPINVHANPTLPVSAVADTIQANIKALRERLHISNGPVHVPVTATPALNLDVLMETGTGKTFTFIETMHRLHRDHKLCKFIVLVPSNAIRQGTIKSLQSTADFFAKQYGKRINVFNYSAKTVGGFIHAAAAGSAGISVMVATYQSFAGESKVINKRGVEANLFGHAKSFMEALAVIRPVIIIDEPHRFEGAVVQEYLPRFNPLITIRFGATFRGKNDDDKYKNLIYTLDSLEAFRQRLVKGIVVDTVGSGSDATQSLRYLECLGTVKERSARVEYHTALGKLSTVELQAKANLGDATGLAFLDGHVVEKITTKEVLFTNGFALPLGEATAYGMLAEQTQSVIIERAVANHFEREEELYKRGIKSLSLFFIDAVAKYMPDAKAGGSKAAVIRQAFEQHYRTHLDLALAKPALHPPYRAYLERSAADISKVHKGYFARSHSEKGEEEAIKLILQEKEKLLGFETDLRFIFSMWALQEGWDNPNVFTLCKLAPSNSQITKLQQIGRGLRLAVNQELQRVPLDDAEFDRINELTVVVPASEGDFVAAIQNEIAAHSIRKVARVVSQESLAASGVSVNPFVTVALFQALAQCGAGLIDTASGTLTLQADAATFKAQRTAIEAALAKVAGLDAVNRKAMLDYMDVYYDGFGAVKRKFDQTKPMLTVNAAQYAKFKELWQSLNRDAVLRYELDTPTLVDNIVTSLERDFKVLPLTINVTRTLQVQDIHKAQSVQSSFEVSSHKVYTLGEFVAELSNATRLSRHTVSDALTRLSPEKFAQIQHNEGRALVLLRDLMNRCVYELLVHKVTYQLRETRVKTALTDGKGALLATIPAALCGREMHIIGNAQVRQRSLYAQSHMPVDSQIERDTVDESHHTRIAVFAKLPKLDIPTPAGKYNPDFGYVLLQNDKAQALYLVVEAKGYDSDADISAKERMKVDSAKQFFLALRQGGIPVQFQTKLNTDKLAQMISQITS
jgi:type III restriction enzyme